MPQQGLKKLTPQDYHVAWICPVRDVELLPARLMLDEEHSTPDYNTSAPSRPRTYRAWRILPVSPASQQAPVARDPMESSTPPKKEYRPFDMAPKKWRRTKDWLIVVAIIIVLIIIGTVVGVTVNNQQSLAGTCRYRKLGVGCIFDKVANEIMNGADFIANMVSTQLLQEIAHERYISFPCHRHPPNPWNIGKRKDAWHARSSFRKPTSARLGQIEAHDAVRGHAISLGEVLWADSRAEADSARAVTHLTYDNEGFAICAAAALTLLHVDSAEVAAHCGSLYAGSLLQPLLDADLSLPFLVPGMFQCSSGGASSEEGCGDTDCSCAAKRDGGLFSPFGARPQDVLDPDPG
ncbi:hypothetical protein GGTG_10772 [Gaeumannomyces tritici R3-111a-1]|uniref:Uncharacterized protein n=1 Tax=Gaeumannomyces tritici (strain R3-111a-1) TaxID=644352 RepID=J3PB99_GAET3|nr:hypothetical protein GGTG_10772 [Gaeumannomyces tritici R3-111a-1]EJT71515.1 hypothetical protein GGTG_10772 [Gaeumannomyces tritici R3-111a-1]